MPKRVASRLQLWEQRYAVRTLALYSSPHSLCDNPVKYLENTIWASYNQKVKAACAYRNILTGIHSISAARLARNWNASFLGPLPTSLILSPQIVARLSETLVTVGLFPCSSASETSATNAVRRVSPLLVTLSRDAPQPSSVMGLDTSVFSRATYLNGQRLSGLLVALRVFILHNFDSRVFIAEGEVRPVMWVCLLSTAIRWKRQDVTEYSVKSVMYPSWI